MGWKLENGSAGKKRLWQSVACIGIGICLYIAAELADTMGDSVEKGKLLRKPCGKGDAVYEFYVDGLMDGEETPVTIAVPEKKMTPAEFSARLPEIVEVLCGEILGDNASLQEVRTDLQLVRELSEFDVSVSWKSERPEIVSAFGVVDASMLPREADLVTSCVVVSLEATLRHGAAEEIVEIPVTVCASEKNLEERFLSMLEVLAASDVELADVILPEEFEGRALHYRHAGGSQNLVLVALGVVAAVCVYAKDYQDLEEERKRRERSLEEAFPDFVTEFLILTGAGYSAKAAWKKMTLKYKEKQNGKRVGNREVQPLYEEMQMAVNQMDAGVPETKVYADFGRRCQLRCYVKFASLLESSVNTGGRNLRRLLEGEMEEALKQRADIAKRKGEEVSAKLLLPMFGMLVVVMIMVVAPAFLSFM